MRDQDLDQLRLAADGEDHTMQVLRRFGYRMYIKGREAMRREMQRDGLLCSRCGERAPRKGGLTCLQCHKFDKEYCRGELTRDEYLKIPPVKCSVCGELMDDPTQPCPACQGSLEKGMMEDLKNILG